jgi:hypothetical protein
MIDFVKVIDGKITTTYKSNKQYVDDNGVRFPVSIWQNEEYLKTQNLVRIQEGTIPNKMFYDIGSSTLSYDAVAKTVTRSYTSNEKSNETLKDYYKKQNISLLQASLDATNYHIIRSQEDSSYSVPSAVSNWRATIYKEFDGFVKTIDACSKISDIKYYFYRATK